MSGKGKTQDRGASCSLLPPGLVCRHYVLPRRFMQALWPRSLLPGPNSTNIVWSCFLQILSSDSSQTLPLSPYCVVHLLRYEKALNQQHQRQYQPSAALPDRFSRNNRQLFFFYYGSVRHIYASYPASSTYLHVKKHLLHRRQRSLSSHPNGSSQPARL